MSKTMLRVFPIIPILLLLALFMPQQAHAAGAGTADALEAAGAPQLSAASSASDYYYFKSIEGTDPLVAGKKINVSFYAGVVIKRTEMDAWGNPAMVTYEEMPVTLKAFKGDTEIWSKSFTYTRGTTIETSFTPKTAGTIKLQIYGQDLGLGSTAQVLQATTKIKVTKKKATAVKNIKPDISVIRTEKKAVEITCANDYGFGMKIYRATKKGGPFKLIATTKKSTYTDTKIAAKKGYYYKVRLFSKAGKKTYLSKWSAKFKVAKYTSAVTLSYTAKKGVKVSWVKIKDAGYYLVVRNNSGLKGDYDVISCEGNDTTTFYDKDVEKGKTYYYGVIAEKGDNEEVVGKYMSNAYKIKVS